MAIHAILPGGSSSVPDTGGYVSHSISPDQMGHVTRMQTKHGDVYGITAGGVYDDYDSDKRPRDTTLEDIRKSEPYVYRHGTAASPHVMWSPEEHRSFFYGQSGERYSNDITFHHSATFQEEGEPHEWEHSNSLTPTAGYH